MNETQHENLHELLRTSAADLAMTMPGATLLPNHAEYETKHGVWNAAVEDRPAILIRCLNATDVVAALAYARNHALTVAVRSGGHSPAGYGTCHAGVVIDLSGMKELEVDALNQTARIEPGLNWGELSGALHEYGLALTAGDTASVGVGGLALGGGIGWFAGKYGLTIDRLRAVELVTSDGQIIRASHDEHAELFWGLRGGGGNFGIATAFEFDLHPGGAIFGGAVFYDAENAGKVLHEYARLALQVPDELTTQVLVMPAPPAPFIPPQMHGKPVLAILMCYCGDLAEGERVVTPLRKLAHPVADLMGPMPYPMLLNLADAGTIRGLRHANRTTFLDAVDESLADALIEAIHANMSPGLLVQLRVLAGAATRVGADETAFAHREKPFLLMLENFCTTATDDVLCQIANNNIWDAIGADSSSTYVNFLGVQETDRVRDAYPASTYARLAALKHQYDPHNIFSRNSNIAPSANYEA
jgi:hypothetical protein